MNMQKFYTKTEKAIKELEQGNRMLSLRHRQLLIMVDGIRSTPAILKVFNKPDVVQLLLDLEKLGYIADKNVSAQTSKTNLNNSSGDPLDNISEEHLDFVKVYLLQNLRLHTGLLGKDLERKIDLVESGKQLKTLIPSWHMTIRGSKIGAAATDKLMENLFRLIANLPSASASLLAS